MFHNEYLQKDLHHYEATFCLLFDYAHSFSKHFISSNWYQQISYFNLELKGKNQNYKLLEYIVKPFEATVPLLNTLKMSEK